MINSYRSFTTLCLYECCITIHIHFLDNSRMDDRLSRFVLFALIFIIVIDYPVTNLIIFSVQHLTSALFKDIISGIIIPPW